MKGHPERMAFFVYLQTIKRTIIIAAGGEGQRMKTDLPKQFIELDGRMIIDHTIDAFLAFDPAAQLIVVLPSDHLATFEELTKVDLNKVTLVSGGINRYASIKNGLQKAEGDLIAIHDAVRPFVIQEIIQQSFEKAEIVGAAVPIVAVKSSLRKITFDESEAVDRSIYKEVQTPQVFKRQVILLAYEQSFEQHFTDDASVVEACGQDIALVEGSDENFKITTPIDLMLAKVFIRARKG